MSARRFSPISRVVSPRVHFIAVLLATATTLNLTPSLGRCLAVSDSGRWTPPNALDGTAVHMALLPGHGPYHSKVMWWYGKGHHESFYGGLLGWKPGEYNCTSYPDTSLLTPISLLMPPDTAEVFCSSESHLASGELFLAGGTQSFTEFGKRHAFLFNPKTLEWTELDSMSAPRYYPSSTTLPTGKQLVTSGSGDLWINFFGGLVSGQAAPLDSALFRYGISGNGRTDSPVRTSSTTLWPSPREGHTAVNTGNTWHVFGGKGRADTLLNEYWHLGRGDNPSGADFDYTWLHLASLNPKPAPRWDHTAVTTGSALATMIVFGGIAKNPEDGSPLVMNDVWRMWYHPQQATSGSQSRSSHRPTLPAPAADT